MPQTEFEHAQNLSSNLVERNFAVKTPTAPGRQKVKLQEFCEHPFTVDLDRCNGSCNTLSNISSKICIPNKPEHVNLNVFNLITRINESKTLINIYHANVDLNLTVNNNFK